MQKRADRSFEEFERFCLKYFRFLEEEFGFRVVKTEREPYGAFITYQNPSTAVRVSLEPREGGIFVLLSRLIERQIPEYPIFVQADTPLHSFYLSDLLTVKGAELPKNTARANSSFPGDIEGTLTEIADLLRVFGSDVLRGDFTIFNELDQVVKKRAGELRGGWGRV